MAAIAQRTKSPIVPAMTAVSPGLPTTMSLQPATTNPNANANYSTQQQEQQQFPPSTLKEWLAYGIMPLHVAVQTYAWGVPGHSSLVGKTYERNTNIAINPDTPYAELWMGDHPNGDASIKVSLATAPGSQANNADSSVKLSRLIKEQNMQFPYLLKILSVNNALSIQAHPDKQLAKQLHMQAPKNYPDDNHKPEMSVALTPFSGMCGFRHVDQIRQSLNSTPELVHVVGRSIVEEFEIQLDAFYQSNSGAAGAVASAANDPRKSLLKSIFSGMMHQDPQVVSEQAGILESRLCAMSSSADANLSPQDALFLDLNKQYPNDVGCFSAYFLNHVLLQEGEAFFMAANEPHAYLKGDCIEIMARSDNVVRAGLTPKFKDVDTLLTMLTYNFGSVDFVKPEKTGSFVSKYVPPVQEFQLERIELPSSQSVTLPEAKGPGILLVIRGHGSVYNNRDSRKLPRLELRCGSVYFVLPGMSVVLESKDENDKPLLVFRSGINESI